MRDVADIAEQAHPRAIGRDVDVLVGVGAVEYQRVGAGLAFDGVAAVARVPDELVVAVAHEGDVVAAAARDDVVAGAADQHVGAAAADDGVVAVAAIDRQVDHAGGEPRRIDRVVAAEAVDDERVVGAFAAGDRHLRGQSRDGDRRAAAGDRDVVVARSCR